MTARACAPEPPCDCWIVTAWPVFAFQYLTNAALNSDVQLARRVVRHVEQRLGAGAAAAVAARAASARDAVKLFS